MQAHFVEFARYNRWANGRIYEAAFALSPDQLWRDLGLFFKSVGGTLNHLLVADRVWMKRFTGVGEYPPSLDTVMFDDLDALWGARQQMDEQIIAYVDGLTEHDIAGTLSYTTMTGAVEIKDAVLRKDLAHFFNHQTHHRGQVHTGLQLLTGEEPPTLDMIWFHRT